MLPEGNLISVKGTLYGATHLGGSHGGGIVYALRSGKFDRKRHLFLL